MSELHDIELALIDPGPDRARPVSEDIAQALATSIAQHGLINPITVSGPDADGRYRLICGAHRLRAVAMLGHDRVEASVTQATGYDAILMEIAENAVRNDLSKLDRAMHVVRWREVWEQKHGTVRRGGDQSAKLALWSDEVGFSGWTAYAQDRLGLSKRSIMRAQEIALKIRPDLRRALSGTPEADNQLVLLRFSDMGEEGQQRAAEMIRAGTPVRDALRGNGGEPAKNGGAAVSRAIAAFSRLNRRERAAFARTLDDQLRAALADAEAGDG